MHELARFSISKTKLLELGEAELTILLGGGKILNELSIIGKQVAFANNHLQSDTKIGPESAAATTLAMTFHRILCGHVFEAHQFLKKNVRVVKMKTSIFLDDDFSNSYKKVNKYFSNSTNVVKVVRDKFAFHTDGAALRNALANTPSDFRYDMIWGDLPSNNLFFGSENMILQRLEEIHPDASPEKMFYLLFTEPATVAYHLSIIFHKLIAAITADYLGLTADDVQRELAPDGPEVTSVFIPFFTKQGTKAGDA